VSVFGDVRDTVAGKLTAGGVSAVTTDPRAGLPCVLVGPVTVNTTVGVGGWSSTVAVEILHPPPGGADALAWLETQLEAVLVVYPAAVPAYPDTVTRNDSDVPAYTLTVPVTVPNPNC
jgi:hypothetical protein